MANMGGNTARLLGRTCCTRRAQRPCRCCCSSWTSRLAYCWRNGCQSSRKLGGSRRCGRCRTHRRGPAGQPGPRKPSLSVQSMSPTGWSRRGAPQWRPAAGPAAPAADRRLPSLWDRSGPPSSCPHHLHVSCEARSCFRWRPFEMGGVPDSLECSMPALRILLRWRSAACLHSAQQTSRRGLVWAPARALLLFPFGPRPRP